MIDKIDNSAFFDEHDYEMENEKNKTKYINFSLSNNRLDEIIDPDINEFFKEISLNIINKLIKKKNYFLEKKNNDFIGKNKEMIKFEKLDIANICMKIKMDGYPDPNCFQCQRELKKIKTLDYNKYIQHTKEELFRKYYLYYKNIKLIRDDDFFKKTVLTAHIFGHFYLYSYIIYFAQCKWSKYIKEKHSDSIFLDYNNKFIFNKNFFASIGIMVFTWFLYKLIRNPCIHKATSFYGFIIPNKQNILERFKISLSALKDIIYSKKNL